MDEKYDAIVLGTGLTECIISGMLSVDGLKVLHIDRNDFYGGESASLQLAQLFERNNRGSPSDALGPSRDYNIDLVPKFLMSDGKLVRILTHLKVTRYLDFTLVDGSFVTKAGKVNKVPASAGEALKSDLMGFFQKRKCKNFFEFCSNWSATDPKTHKGVKVENMSCRGLFEHFDLSEDTVDFIGHAVALFTNDEYLDRPALETMERVKLYESSFARWSVSPFIYPMFGLGELPQAFARLCAVCGGTYMLNKPIEEIVFNEAGEAIGVKSEGETATARFVVGDPSYFPDKVRQTGKVAKAICILSHPVPNTNDSDSCQIILPQKQTGRRHDIYVCVTSSKHRVAPQGKYIAVCATTAETDDAEAELRPALELLGRVDAMFTSILPYYEPKSDGNADKCFISKSYDATTHFESVADDVLSLYERITGKPFDWTKSLPFGSEDDGEGASGSQ